MLTDGAGDPLAFRLTAGQAAEQAAQALPLLEGRRADAVIADKGYDTRAIVAAVQQMGAKVVILSRSHWLMPRGHDRTLYKTRNCIERCFGQRKQFRRFATLLQAPVLLLKHSRDRLHHPTPQTICRYTLGRGLQLGVTCPAAVYR